ncbi:hypothetical protein DFQ27_005449 [Actinomortierella ambigua]|uniref:Transmembrane protein 135 N-terminal domain-containing protein n=1 Tax=Actinomortierella ambigua TaxID=1343610 RepID=A0A9P6QL66_9FUNG|nr:hypothetical protein DFQ27_005449 [Actinomortierella ambigua]
MSSNTPPSPNDSGEGNPSFESAQDTQATTTTGVASTSLESKTSVTKRTVTTTSVNSSISSLSSSYATIDGSGSVLEDEEHSVIKATHTTDVHPNDVETTGAPAEDHLFKDDMSSPSIPSSSSSSSSLPTISSSDNVVSSITETTTTASSVEYKYTDQKYINGKRSRHYRTKEGREAAERAKQFKRGTTIPHLNYRCDTQIGVLRHALLGAVRSFGVTYGMKALVNFLLGLIKVSKGNLKLHRGKDDRINGAIAGAIAGLAILIENHDRRVTFAQQMLIRAGQGVYNAAKHRGRFEFRHGDALLFALGSAQVLYAYCMQPDTIPPEYFGFMVKTARVHTEALAFNRARVRGFPVDVSQVKALVERLKPTKRNLEIVSQLTEYTDIIPCAVLHPSFDSCRVNNVERFIQVTKNILPVYATLNFVPMLILRMKRLLADPVGVLSKTSFNTLRSSVFLAVFVALYQSQICTHRSLFHNGWVNSNSKYLYWLFGFTCSGAAIMVEQESRRAELAMYVLPKAAESLYKILYQKNWIKGVKHWEVMMFSCAMSLIMSFYQQEEQVLSPFVTKLIYHILGKN